MPEITIITGFVLVSLVLKAAGIFALAYLGARLAIRHERGMAK